MVTDGLRRLQPLETVELLLCLAQGGFTAAQLRLGQRQCGTLLRIIELIQQIAGLHLLPVAEMDLSNDAFNAAAQCHRMDGFNPSRQAALHQQRRGFNLHHLHGLTGDAQRWPADNENHRQGDC